MIWFYKTCLTFTGLDPQIKAWMDHCACVVKTGLAIHTIDQPNQKAVLSIASMQSLLLVGVWGYTPKETFLNYILWDWIWGHSQEYIATGVHIISVHLQLYFNQCCDRGSHLLTCEWSSDSLGSGPVTPIWPTLHTNASYSYIMQ